MKLALALMIVVMLFAATAQRSEAHTGSYVVASSAGNGLNLREGPSGSYRVIMTMAKGSALKAYGHVGSWMKVQHLATGNIGWASMTYIVAASSAPASSGSGYCMTNYWREFVCASANVANAIRYWANYYGVGQWWLFAVAACESSFNPGAYNSSSGVSGLFQFMPSTFWAYGGHDLWDPWDQSRVAAYMFSRGLAFHWHCARLLGYA